MADEPKRRPRRTPLSPEEVAHLIALKKWRAFKKLEQLKQSRTFKLLNIFNITCFFIYIELLFCYIGPCNYVAHYSYDVKPRYGDMYGNGKRIVMDIDVLGVNGVTYNFVIEDSIKIPDKKIRFLVGKDYLLHKNMKGVFEKSGTTYRLFSASPILFLCIFVTVMSSFAFMYNFNENAYSLNALTVLNFLTALGILCL